MENSNKIKNEFNIFTVEGRAYAYDEIMEILKAHKKEEDSKYHICDRCGERFLENKEHNMVECNLDIVPEPGSAIGYMHTPYIEGFRIISTCGNGRDIKLCDKCIAELLIWIKNITKHGYWTGRLSIDDACAEGYDASVSEVVRRARRESDKHTTHCSVCGAQFDDRIIGGWKGCPRCFSILDLERPADAYFRNWENYGKAQTTAYLTKNNEPNQSIKKISIKRIRRKKLKGE